MLNFIEATSEIATVPFIKCIPHLGGAFYATFLFLNDTNNLHFFTGTSFHVLVIYPILFGLLLMQPIFKP